MGTTRVHLLLALAALVSACGCAPEEPAAAGRSAAPGAAAPEVREVAVAPVALATWERTLRLTGELRPAETATLASKVAGRLEALDVDVASRVTRGQALARLDRRDFELECARATASVQAARAQLGLAPDADVAGFDPEESALVREARALWEQAGREHARRVSLVEGGADTQSALDGAAAELAASESRLQAARETIATRRATLVQREAELAIAAQSLADTEILAPFDGVVAERLAGTGDFLPVGAPIVRVLRDDPARLVVTLPEQHSAGVRPGLELRVRFDSGAPPLAAQIARIAPALTASDRNLVVEADLPNPGGVLRPGSFVRAELVLEADARTLVVPPAALVRFAGIEKVFVAEDGVARERRVRIGRIEAERLEVLEGLQAGERVVLDPGKLQGGTRLAIRE